jgi:hypothetical protein
MGPTHTSMGIPAECDRISCKFVPEGWRGQQGRTFVCGLMCHLAALQGPGLVSWLGD